MSKRDTEQTITPTSARRVRALCADFPGEYWRALDRERAYPTEFVQALTEAGFLAALIPEEYGGSGLSCRPPPRSWRRSTPRAATAPPATRRCTSWARCCGTAAPSRSSATCRRSPSGELRLQAFGVTEPTSGTDTLSAAHHRGARRRRHYVVNGQKIWTSRAEHSDLMLLLARTTPREQVKKRTDGPVGLPRRHARAPARA